MMLCDVMSALLQERTETQQKHSRASLPCSLTLALPDPATTRAATGPLLPGLWFDPVFTTIYNRIINNKQISKTAATAPMKNAISTTEASRDQMRSSRFKLLTSALNGGSQAHLPQTPLLSAADWILPCKR